MADVRGIGAEDAGKLDHRHRSRQEDQGKQATEPGKTMHKGTLGRGALYRRADGIICGINCNDKQRRGGATLTPQQRHNRFGKAARMIDTILGERMR